jgi:hypothetical protein
MRGAFFCALLACDGASVRVEQEDVSNLVFFRQPEVSVLNKSEGFAEKELAGVFDYIETFYNRTRLHSNLAHQSPATLNRN